MRRAVFPFLILTLILTACGTFEVSLTNSDQLASTPASDSADAGRAPLSMDSASAEIRQRLIESPMNWRTIFMDARVVSAGEPDRRVQAWVDQPALSARVLGGAADGSAESLRAVDGASQLDLNILTGESSMTPFSGGEAAPPFTPQPPALDDNVIEPHPLSSVLGSPLDVLIFPSAIAQNEGAFKPVGMEVAAYRLALIVEWTYSQNQLPSYRAWVDVSTGVFLRFQQFDKGGGTDILSETTVSRVDYDLPFPAAFFSPIVSAMPDFSEDPLALAVSSVTPAAPAETDPLGWIYSFVADHSYPVRVMRWVRLPASCAVGAADCPRPEVVKMPVPLTSALQPVVWSPTRNEAAWVYPLDPDQRIWTLHLFDAAAKTWKELAQMDRSMDPPTWSRSGEWLAFRAQDGKGGADVYVVRRDGNDLKRLTASPDLPAEGRPYVMDAWLGENLALRSANSDWTGAAFLMRVSDGSAEPFPEAALTNGPFVESPDGGLLAYVDFEDNSRKQLARTVTPDGKTRDDLAAFVSGIVTELTWSPDGGQLGFVHVTDDFSNVYVINRDGRNLRQAFASKTDAHFVFSPDGKYLLVQTMDGTGQHLYAVNLSTLESRLVQAPGVPLDWAWAFASLVK